MKKFIISLQNKHILSSPRYFALLAVIKKANLRIKSGEYLITSHTTPTQLLNHIIKGQVYMRKITFVEGTTFTCMRNQLNKNPYLKHTINSLSNQQIMQAMHADNHNPEGLFFPNTYEYTWGNSDLLVLKSAYQLMQRTLNQQWQQRAHDVPYQSVYQALIVASLVERETALKKERPIIAGIILNRLQLGMRLQIDPTVLYGVGKNFGVIITHNDLSDQNLYNTYRHPGLPPTPIAMPGLQSIVSALHPQKSTYLYYVANASGDHSHTFSVNYHDHLVAVGKYRQREMVDKKEEKSNHPN